MSAFDSGTGATVLFGGSDSTGARLGDTWVWDGTFWFPLAVSGPSPRAGSALAGDGLGVVLFGGIDASGTRLGDTWRLTMTGWSRLSPPTSPVARSDHALVRTRAGALLFGGTIGPGGALADTWLWDGSAWQQQNPATSPTPRSGHAMAYDAYRDRVVLFGGSDASGQLLSDWWEWNGSTWTQLVLSTTPAARTDAAMAYEPSLGAIVLYGGRGPTVVPFGDTWTYDGRAARRVSTNTVLFQARSATAIAIDRNGNLTLFGGLGTPGSVFGGTWRLVLPNRGRASPFGTACAGTAGPPSLAPAPGDLPWVGAPFTLRFRGLPGGNPMVLSALGLSNRVAGTTILPVNLGFFGMPGCQWYVSAELTATLVGSGGRADWSIVLPGSTAFVGASIFGQGLVTDPGANAAGLTSTNAIELRLGLHPSSIEEFDDERMMDRDGSSGSWSGGRGTFGAIGGSGKHGDFDHALGTFAGVVNGLETYVWSTDFFLIPSPQTPGGTPALVTDGRFEFVKLTVPAGVRVRFAGSNPVRLDVRGRIRIEGELDFAGEDVPGGFNGAPAISGQRGQPGSAGGPGGGSGGAGGDRCDGNGPSPLYDGRPGLDVGVSAGHAYAGSAQGTGGSGSTLFPATGLIQSVVAPPGSFFSFQSAGGGGGGGFMGAGGQGLAVGNSFNNPAYLGPPAAGGTAFPLFPIPFGAVSSSHFQVGGSGGGGGGSHPLFSNTFVRVFSAGAGGAGGGGAAALRAGFGMILDSAASVRARGGSAADYTGIATQGTPAPGGGGSGGSLLVQVGQAADLLGTLDLRGGTGGTINRGFPAGGSAVTRGGDGASGFLRLEGPPSLVNRPPAQLLPGAQPPAGTNNVGVLTEADVVTGFQSRWYVAYPAPRYVRYEIEAIVGANRVVFSDDPSVGVLARPGTQPVGALFQGAELDLVVLEPTLTGAWRTFVGGFGAASGELGLVDDALPAFRFVILRDLSFGQNVQIERVRVVFG